MDFPSRSSPYFGISMCTGDGMSGPVVGVRNASNAFNGVLGTLSTIKLRSEVSVVFAGGFHRNVRAGTGKPSTGGAGEFSILVDGSATG